MKVAVTGASGHIGNVLCRQLIEAGHTVRALYHSQRAALDGLDLETVRGDVLNPSDLDTLVNGCEVVFHCAAKISIHGDLHGSVHAINTLGPKNVLEACIRARVRKIIHVSSIHAVHELPHREPMTEERPYKTKGAFAYDYSKAVGEQIMLSTFRTGRIAGCVVRPSSVLGPFDFKPSELGKALLGFQARKIPLLTPGGYNFVDVRDVANAMMAAIDHGRNGEVYFLTGYYHTIWEVAETVHSTIGVKVPKQILPFWMMKLLLPFVRIQGKLAHHPPVYSIESITALKNGHPNINNTKARRELGLKTRSLAKSIRDFYEWQETGKADIS